MLPKDDWFDLAFNSFKKIIFPKSWLKLDTELAKQDLFALILLEKLGESTMSQIAEQLNFPLSTTTGIVDRLVKKGLAMRIRSESDRRIVLIEITENGRSLSTEFKTKISDIIGRINQLLNEEEMAVLLKLISRLNDIFEPLDVEEEGINPQNQIQKIRID